ncbi:MAG TPA: three-Cys-motif partner protein TcmP [Candidatus Cloacimonadota bacterium]|mgnify:CR=1 FL=1|nr:three-Cys-motif partner protein TcmP [Candidatus Cloacimonadota bacterium]HQL15548.1 three-Cys-motif partner protein TcmP [Candidatus Cloacimonadota bacterium]
MATHNVITYPGKPYFAFKYEEQTMVKHEVFKSYFDKWVKIVGHKHRLNFIDCFGGCGIYDYNGELEPGSPIIASQIIENNANSLNRNCCVTILDIDKNCTDNIPLAFKLFNCNYHYKLINDDFELYINNKLDALESKGKTLCPTFFLIDPYGYKIRLETIKRLMAVKNSEIYFNFMFNAVNRGISSGKVDNTMDELFGCTEWRDCQQFHGIEREACIIDLLRNQFKLFSRYVLPYRICFPKVDRTYFYMIHLTNYVRGCEIMKACFAELNHGKIEYLGKKQNQMHIFDLIEDPVQEIESYICTNFKNSGLSFDELLDKMIDTTPYLGKDISSAVLNLYNRKLANIRRVSSKKQSSKPTKKDFIEIS